MTASQKTILPMTNSQDQMSTASRIMVANALLGGSASALNQWRHYQAGRTDVHQMTRQVLGDTIKAGIAGGVATAIAGKMAGRPVLSMITLLTAGAATLYLIDEARNDSDE